jgi:hypothetical protein
MVKTQKHLLSWSDPLPLEMSKQLETEMVFEKEITIFNITSSTGSQVQISAQEHLGKTWDSMQWQANILSPFAA